MTVNVFSDADVNRSIAIMLARNVPIPARVALAVPSSVFSSRLLRYSLFGVISSPSISSILSSDLDQLISQSLQSVPYDERLTHVLACSGAPAIPVFDLRSGSPVPLDTDLLSEGVLFQRPDATVGPEPGAGSRGVGPLTVPKEPATVEKGELSHD